MKLGHRAALITVAIVAATASAAAMLVIDTLPAVEDSAVELARPSGIIDPAAVLETGSLPRGPVFSDEAVSSTQPSEDNQRLAFVPPGSQHFLLGPLTAEQWATAVIEQSEMIRQDEDEADAAHAWSTVTNAAKTAGGDHSKHAGLAAPDRNASMLGRSDLKSRNASLHARLIQIAPSASERIAAKFKAAKAQWPPAEISLLAIKDEKVLEMYARAPGGAWMFIHRYPVLAASGGAGPKLVRGDKQVPEGIYRISFLNPNSRYHVSMRVDYPNSFDRRMAAKDGRRDLGNDIMIHGKKSSAGCLAMGDEAAEELFVLAASIGLPNVKLVIAPTDLRRHPLPAGKPGQPAWVGRLYTEVASAMSPYKAPPPSSSGSLLSLLGL